MAFEFGWNLPDLRVNTDHDRNPIAPHKLRLMLYRDQAIVLQSLLRKRD